MTAVSANPAGQSQPPALRGRVWQEGRLTGRSFELAELDGLIADPQLLVWADLLAPDEATLVQMGEELGLSPLALEDAVAPHERPKATRHEHHSFITVYATLLEPGPDGELALLQSRVSAFVLDNALITVRADGLLDMDRVVALWDDNPQLVQFGVLGLLHGLLDVVVDDQFLVMQHLDDRLEAMEDLLFEETPAVNNREVQRRTFRVRHELVELRRNVLPMRDVVNAVMRNGQNWPTQLRSYYDDLLDHVLRASEWSESLRDMIANLFESSLALNDTRMNEVMKRLAAWAAIIAVPTLITGWFGMNIPYWGFGTLLGVVLCTGLMLVSMITLFVSFRSRDWL